MNPAAEGKEYPQANFAIDPARVEAFKDVIGQQAPGVPTTFLTAAEFTVIPTIAADPELALDFSRVLHTEQRYDVHRPLRLGETLTIHPRIESIRTRGGTGLLTLVTELRDAADQPVATARSTLMEREAEE
jgi:hypothetical protein